MSAHVILKANRLITEGRVEHVPAARVFTVQGDTGAHHVTVVNGTAWCTCPAPLGCSHALAARHQAEALDEHLGAYRVAA